MGELSRLGIEQLDFEQLAEKLSEPSLEALFYAIGAGAKETSEVVDRAIELSEIRDNQLSLTFVEGDAEKVILSGLGGMDYVISECCKPVPGDSIVGVIDDESVVNVHLQDCLQTLKADIYGSLIRLDWQEEVSSTFPVSIEVSAYDRSGLLYDITGIFKREDINVLSIQTLSDKKNNIVILKMVFEVAKLSRLLGTLERIAQLPNVITARRTITS